MAIQLEYPHLAKIMEPQIVSECLKFCITERLILFLAPETSWADLVTKFLRPSHPPGSNTFIYPGHLLVLIARWRYTGHASTQRGEKYQARKSCRRRRLHSIQYLHQMIHGRETEYSRNYLDGRLSPAFCYWSLSGLYFEGCQLVGFDRTQSVPAVAVLIEKCLKIFGSCVDSIIWSRIHTMRT